MAIYYLDLSKGTKGKKDKKGKGIYRGKSALAKYNYIIRDENYIKGKEEILATEYGYLPNFAKDNPAFFWEATDKYEAKNGVVFRKLIFALPRELNAEQQQELCQQFAEAVCGKYKLPYTYAIHKGEFDHKGNRKTEDPNPHCHLIFNELEALDHLSNFEHLNNIKAVNYEISKNRTNADNLRKLQSRTSNEDKYRARKPNTNPMPTQQSIDLGQQKPIQNSGVQPLGEGNDRRGGRAYTSLDLNELDNFSNKEKRSTI